MAAFDTPLESMHQLLAPMWVEFLFMLFFVIGFTLLRCGLFNIPGGGKGSKGKKIDEDKSNRISAAHKATYMKIEASAEAGQRKSALKEWDTIKEIAPTPIDTLKTVVGLLLEEKPEAMVDEVVEHFGTHSKFLSNGKNATAALDVVARAGRADLLDQLAKDLRFKLRMFPTFQVYEVLLGGHASAGDEKRVTEICDEIRGSGQKLTARGYSLSIKGFLKNGLVTAALRQIQDMYAQGFSPPSFAVAQLFRLACQMDRHAEVLDAFQETSKTLQLPPEAVVVLLEECQKRNDLALALRVEKTAKGTENALTVSAYDPLLKVCVAHADVHALQLFKDMQTNGMTISEGLCVGLLARCAESKFLRLAEDIVSFVQGNMKMSIAVYSALMKVYAYSGMYGKACDLYENICADGLVPDSTMYGCLMKFSVECGRTELSRELFSKAPSLDIQNYMSLIRAAGRDKNIDRAFAVLDKLKASGVSVDIAAYNCVLDACVSAGDLKRARSLMVEMRGIASLDNITYNTLLKGYCSKGYYQEGKEILEEMRTAGLTPDDVSYNCLINAAVSAGNFNEAWSIIEMMERNGVKVDHYTISIMMKSLKKVKGANVDRALELLDKSGVDACSDEVLFNTVLETCTRHRQLHRLESLINKFGNSKLRPSVHTFGSLIKACSTLKCPDKCRKFWAMMVDEYAMQPNAIVLGCMLDALVCNSQVEDAVILLGKWKAKIAPNTIMYSTIIKGFANSRQASRALDMWEEITSLGVTFNNVLFNALIDSQARVGAMDKVSMLVESMESNGCAPDSITYATIVKGYCVQGDLDRAFEAFRSAQKNGMAIDSVVYNTIMSGCTRHNRVDLAGMVLEDMEKYGIKPSSSTLGILVKMYVQCRQLDKAFQVAEEFPRKHGVQVNVQARTCLLDACLGSNNIDRAMKIFDEIKASGEGVDAKTYSSVISGLVRHGRLERAAALVDEAYGLTGKSARGRLLSDQKLDSESLEQLVQALGQHQLMHSIGMPLLERLRAARVPVSGRLFALAVQ